MENASRRGAVASTPTETGRVTIFYSWDLPAVDLEVPLELAELVTWGQLFRVALENIDAADPFAPRGAA